MRYVQYCTVRISIAGYLGSSVKRLSLRRSEDENSLTTDSVGRLALPAIPGAVCMGAKQHAQRDAWRRTSAWPYRCESYGRNRASTQNPAKPPQFAFDLLNRALYRWRPSQIQ